MAPLSPWSSANDVSKSASRDSCPLRLHKRVRDALARRQVTLRGEWHLWIYCCEWCVFSCRKIVGDSSSSCAIRKAIDHLDSQALVQASFSYRGCRSVFEFDLGARLITKPCDTDSEQWMLYEPTGKVLTLRGTDMFTHQPGDTPPDVAVWRSAWSD